ncbi:MAG: hypothetical protein GQ574_02685 [Crocinitomix sp.]|nr:hypothetical protein [Crocinitomix sp.]
MYQHLAQHSDITEVPRGGKTITEINNKDKGIYGTKNVQAFKNADGKEVKGHFLPNQELFYLDHNEDWVLLEGTLVNLAGDEITLEVGWVKMGDTNFDPEDEKFTEIILTKKIMVELEQYDNDLTSNMATHDENIRDDYNKKNPTRRVKTADDIPDGFGENYDAPGNDIHKIRVGLDVAAKKKAAQVIVDHYDAYYNLKSIFDAKDLSIDMENEENDRVFFDSFFPNDDAKVQLGGYPKEKEDVHDILNLGENKWMATMEVTTSKPKRGELRKVSQVILNFPMQELMGKFWNISNAEDMGKSYKVISKKTGVLAIMLAHEYIHAAQNTQKEHDAIANLPWAENTEWRRSVREILAYHFTAFPNKKYTDPANDPVFASTDFVRGETATFKEFPEIEFAFLIWKGLDYFRDYRKGKDAAIAAKYRLEELEKDYLEAAERLKNGPYKIDINYTDKQHDFMSYLKKISTEHKANFENLVHKDSKE